MYDAKRWSLVPLAVMVILGSTRGGQAADPSEPWTAKDIGPRLAPGVMEVDPRGFWTLRASNGDVSQSADSFFFVSRPLSGDGSVLALLLGQEGGEPQWAKTGIMIRQNDTASAANVHLHMTSGHGLAVTCRVIRLRSTTAWPLQEGG
jgi:hypothetical protein